MLDRTKGTSTNGSRSRHSYIHTYIYNFARVTFAVVYRKAGSGKKEKKKEKEKKKKEKTNISRLRTVNSHSRSLKKEREREKEKRKYLGRNWQMTETSSCSCTRPFTAGQFIQVYTYIRVYLPWLRMLPASIHRVEPGDPSPGGGRWVRAWGGIRLREAELHDSSAILFALFRRFNSRRAGF